MIFIRGQGRGEGWALKELTDAPCRQRYNHTPSSTARSDHIRRLCPTDSALGLYRIHTERIRVEDVDSVAPRGCVDLG